MNYNVGFTKNNREYKVEVVDERGKVVNRIHSSLPRASAGAVARNTAILLKSFGIQAQYNSDLASVKPTRGRKPGTKNTKQLVA